MTGWRPRDHVKAACFRVLLRSRPYPEIAWRFWWPIISADDAADASAIAQELYGGLGMREGKGLPFRGEVEVIEAIRLHSTEVHNRYLAHVSPTNPSVNRLTP